MYRRYHSKARLDRQPLGIFDQALGPISNIGSGSGSSTPQNPEVQLVSLLEDEDSTRVEERLPGDYNETPKIDTSSIVNNKGSVEAPSIQIYKVSGHNGRHVWLGENPLPSFATVFDIRFSIGPSADDSTNRNKIDVAADDLLETIQVNIDSLKKTSNDAKPSAIIFLARDLGGTVVKQALVKASKKLKLQHIAKITTHVVSRPLETFNGDECFFGTPHRTSAGQSWEFIISNLVYPFIRDDLSSSLPFWVRQLAASQAALATDFNLLCRQYELNIFNFYQETSGVELYEISLPKFALNYDREVQIGCPESLHTIGDLSQPEIHRIFRRVIQDASACREPNYRATLSLLSRYEARVVSFKKSKPIYKSLCNLLFSNTTFSKLFGISGGTIRTMPNTISEESSPTRLSQTDQHDQEVSEPVLEWTESVMLSINLNGWAIDVSALVASLIEIIDKQRLEHAPYSQFITLALCPPVHLSIHIIELLVSIIRQYLMLCPQGFHRIQSQFNELREVVQTNNMTWKETFLWRLLKYILRNHRSGHLFIIIHVPEDKSMAKIFQNLASNMSLWLSDTEAFVKILLIHNANSRLDPEVLTIQTNKDDSLFRAQFAIREDHKTELMQIVEENPKFSAFTEVLNNLSNGCTLTPKLQILSFENQILASSWQGSPTNFTIGSEDILITLVLNSIPNPMQPWIKNFLIWITYAIRPLRHTELPVILNRNLQILDEKESSIRLTELQRLFFGLIEENGHTIYPTNEEAARLLAARMARGNEQWHSHFSAGNINAEKDQPTIEWYESRSHPHIQIAQYCVKILRKHFQSQNAPVTKPMMETENCDLQNKSGETSILAYAAENWFTHVYLWAAELKVINGVHKAEECIELVPVLEFINDQNLFNQWLQLRNSLNGLLIERPDCFNTAEITKLLGLDLQYIRDIIKFVDLIQHVNETEIGKDGGPHSSLVIALAQLGDVDTLAKLDNTIFQGPLEAAFLTASDSASCYLAEKYPDFVSQNWNKLLSSAIHLGNLELLRLLSGIKPTDAIDNKARIFHRIAELGSYLPPEDLWHQFKSQWSATSLDGRTALHVAAEHGHLALVGKLLDEGLDVNQRDSSGVTPLFLAASHGNLAIANKLIAAEADPFIGDTDKTGAHQTPLHVSSASGNLKIVHLLLSRGVMANITMQDCWGNTPLHLALENNHTEVAKAHVRALQEIPTVSNSKSLPKVPGLDSTNQNSETLLMIAIKEGSVDIVKSLLDLGAKADIPDKKGRVAIHYAAALRSSSILSWLLKSPDVNVNALDSGSLTPLHIASSRGRAENVKMLLAKKANCNATDEMKHYPLGLACERGYIDVVRAMVFSCNTDHITKEFLSAVSRGNTDIAELLIDAGADFNASLPGSSSTALHQGSSTSNIRLVRSLLLRRAKLNPQDEYGRTPLYEAACRNAHDCLKLLVDAGADVDIPDSEGTTALYAAAIEGYTQCVDILLAAKANIGPSVMPFETPWQRGLLNEVTIDLDIPLREFRSGILEMVLQHISQEGYDWEVSNEALYSLLRYDSSAVDKLRLLLDAELKHDRIIGNYGTMLHYAALWDNPDVASLLSENGRASPGIVYRRYGTPLQVATERAKPNSLKIVRKLLSEGANAELGSGRYGSPLHAAAYMPWSNRDEIYLGIARAIIEHTPKAIHKEAGAYPTVLQAAVAGGTLGMVELILDNNPDLTIVAGKWGTPLHLAVKTRATRHTNLLLSRCGPLLTIGTVDREGRLPLHLASTYDDWMVSEFNDLCDDKYRPTKTDLQGRHLAHFCAGRGNRYLLSRVLEEKPDSLEDKDEDGWTPLHWACRQGSSTVINFLLVWGANRNATTRHGWRPVDIAKYHGADQGILSLIQPDDDGITGNSMQNLETSLEEKESLPVQAGYTSAECDSCFCRIYGPRYHCEQCDDFDMCFKCYRHIKKIHYEDHTFVKK